MPANPLGSLKVIRYGNDPAVLQSKVIGFSILVVIRIHCIGFRVGAKSHISGSRACTFLMSIMTKGTQKAIFLRMGGWNSYNMVQAVQKNAQKSQNLLYHISLKRYHTIAITTHNWYLCQCIKFFATIIQANGFMFKRYAAKNKPNKSSIARTYSEGGCRQYPCSSGSLLTGIVKKCHWK